MTEKVATKEKPSHALASRITTRLVKEGLIAEDRQTRVVEAFAAGTLSQGDWRIEVERTIDREEGTEDATKNQ